MSPLIPAPAGNRKERSTRSPSPASHLSPTPTALCIGRSTGCSRSPTCIWKKARASPHGVSCCRLMIRPPRLARLARLIAHYAPRCVSSRSATVSTTAAGRRGCRMEDRDNLLALQRGRDWIWITGNHDPEPADNIGGAFHATVALGALTLPPSADRRCRRGRRSSASGRARVAARPRRQPALLCRGRDASGDAGFRRFHRRPQYSRCRFCRSVRHA